MVLLWVSERREERSSQIPKQDPPQLADGCGAQSIYPNMASRFGDAGRVGVDEGGSRTPGRAPVCCGGAFDSKNSRVAALMNHRDANPIINQVHMAFVVCWQRRMRLTTNSQY